MSLTNEVKEQIGRANLSDGKRAALAEAFLSCGVLSVSMGYNLEFVSATKEQGIIICGLLNHFGVKAHSGEKNGRFRAYVKDKEGVCDALAAMGASKTVLKINSLIAQRDLRKQTARQSNCDMYNLDKLTEASVIQVEAIKNLNLTDEKLIKTAKARLDYPQASYDELKDILGVSKSTVKYRLQKIVSLYKRESSSQMTEPSISKQGPPINRRFHGAKSQGRAREARAARKGGE